jgi:two-component sensor histidine kinase
MNEIDSTNPVTRISRKLDSLGDLLASGDYNAETWIDFQTILGKNLDEIDVQYRRLSTELHETMHQHRNDLQTLRNLLHSADPASTVKEFRQSIDSWLESLTEGTGGKPYDDEGLTFIKPMLNSLIDSRRYRFTTDRRRFHGSPVLLPAGTIKILTLLIKELSMNAMKYGGFGKNGGAVDIAWQVEGTGPSSTLVVNWRETCNSEIKLPVAAGKGYRFITEIMPDLYNFQLEEDHQPTGFRYVLRFPHEMVPMPGSPNVLMVEDDVSYYDFFDSLLEGTNINMSYAASVADASHFIRHNQELDFVLLDRTLRDGDGFSVAEELDSLHVPYAFFTGSVDADWGKYSRALRISKPLTDDFKTLLHVILTSPHLRRVK